MAGHEWLGVKMLWICCATCCTTNPQQIEVTEFGLKQETSLSSSSSRSQQGPSPRRVAPAEWPASTSWQGETLVYKQASQL